MYGKIYNQITIHGELTKVDSKWAQPQLTSYVWLMTSGDIDIPVRILADSDTEGYYDRKVGDKITVLGELVYKAGLEYPLMIEAKRVW